MLRLEGLTLWLDPDARTGPQSMAVDEWLLANSTAPVLRVYRWLGEWGSIGYFDKLGDARAAFPDIPQWVRRWSGGGTVDHRSDWAYTVIIPSPAARDGRLGGAESYQAIHSALAKSLQAEGHQLRLSHGTEATGAMVCFENPVTHDLVNGHGEKLAGAGQRRSRTALMHQGSVALPLCDEHASRSRAERLAGELSQGDWVATEIAIPQAWLDQAVQSRYGDPEWTQRRP